MALDPALLSAIASPRRREILRLLWNEELTAGAINAAFPDVTFGAVSLQLRALEKAGLVSVRPQGRHRYYRVQRERLGPVGRAARTDVGRRALAPQDSGRIRKHAPRAPSAPPTRRRTEMTTLAMPHRLERSILIQRRATSSSATSPTARGGRAGGARARRSTHAPAAPCCIVHPGGVQVAGEILEIDPPARLVFTYGYVSGTPMPVGASIVTIRLEDDREGTRLDLSHDFADEKVRDEMVQGWRFQLSLFGNLVANDLHAGASTAVDGWFAAWSEPDTAKREALLDRLATEEIRFRDRFSLIDGLSDLRPHLAAVHRFMPGMRLEREGDVRHCQGTVLADWVARAADGTERGRGTNVFAIGHHGRIESVTGFWGPPKKQD